MKSQVTLEIEHPDEWELAEKDARQVNPGEWHWNDGEIGTWRGNKPSDGKYPIMRRVRWKPKRGEEYYVVESCDVFHSTWRDDSADKARYDEGSCFRTREAAQREFERTIERRRAIPDEER